MIYNSIYLLVHKKTTTIKEMEKNLNYWKSVGSDRAALDYSSKFYSEELRRKILWSTGYMASSSYSLGYTL